ncbi:MAG: flagellar basal body rod protein FlgB [Nitratireductor sp.]|nr:flagellar basal body rod protein FlgB [Nitratireductor sp.]
MSEIYLGKLADVHAQWSSVRQSVIAGNIANANTVGFKASDVTSFEEVLSNVSFGKPGEGADISIHPDKPWDVMHSGTAVSLANEMIKAGDTASAFELNTSVMRSFHRMVISAFGN